MPPWGWHADAMWGSYDMDIINDIVRVAIPK
jgi:hypothetical protein